MAELPQIVLSPLAWLPSASLQSAALQSAVLPQQAADHWQGASLWLNVVGDALLALVFFAVPVALFWLVRRRPDLGFRPLVRVLTLFMIACGLLHAAAVFTVWIPAYWLSGSLKLFAVASAIGGALMLMAMLPRMLALPTASALQQINAELEHEITLRVSAELDLRAAYQELEERVAQRTRELSASNERLTQEIEERRRTEEALRHNETLLRRLHDHLEDRITERTAELTRTIGELEAFSYSISHDLRAPLRAINGYAAILAEEHGGALPAEGCEVLDRIARNAAKMAQLIDGLLDFSRLARAETESAAIDMNTMVRAVVTEMQAEQKGGAPIVTVGALPRSQGHEGMLRQVWTNLLSNAFKFSAREAAPRIEIAGERTGDEVVYSVRDNGVGFDMAYAEKLFGVFNRLHAASEFPGVGVGLAIVRRIVARHGGRVWAESVRDDGSTFFFTLPAGQAEAGLAGGTER